MKRAILLLIVLCGMIFVIYGQERGADRADLIPDLMAEINLWRLQQGLEPVVYNPLLEELAIYQADYLMEQGDIGDIHAGRQGETPRQRSQFPQYSWATYGHPELFSVTEIAAIGSIESAMDFWMNSRIHTESALNPTYREVGIAARQRNTGVLFIVVFGGQPNVLTALADPDVDEIYLTNERNTWQGDWIGVADQYRLLAPDLTPLTAWLEWEPRIELPEVDEDIIYIQYQTDGNRVTYPVHLDPIWSLSPEERALEIAIDLSQLEAVEAAEDSVNEAIAALPTGTPTLMPTNTPEPSIFATSTPIPTITPIPSPTIVIPTLTPRPTGVVRIVYDEDYLTVINASPNNVDLYGMTLSDGNFTFNSLTWEVPADVVNIGSLPPNQCVQIGGFTQSNTVNPLEECIFVLSLVTISEDNFFWLDGTFEIAFSRDVVATCGADANICEFEVD